MQFRKSLDYLRIVVFTLIICFCVNESKAQFYTGSYQEFGQNRVQFNGFQWQSFDFQRFKIFFYKGGEDLAIYTAKSAHKSLQELERQIDFYMKDKIEFIVYNKQSHFKQSNIGLTPNTQTNIGGVTRIVGSKIFLYYDGEHSKLDEQIRSGLVEIMLSQMMYGGNWRDVMKNSTLLTLPKWYNEGVIAYLSRGWDEEIDSWVKDGVLSKKYNKFNQLEGKDAINAGHAIWNYIGEIYGENVIPNILYMSRISRNVESGFLFVLGISLRTLSNDYLIYYRKKFEKDNESQMDPTSEMLKVKTKKTRDYFQFRVSPDGRNAVFASNELGQIKIWLHDIAKQKTKRIIKRDHKLNRIIDHSYPIINWHPSGTAFSFVEEKKGEVELTIYDLNTEKFSTRKLLRIDKVISYDYSDDGKSIVFSGVSEGKTNLFLYSVLGNTHKKLTNDIYDDMYPRFIDGSNKIIFSSNREDDTVRLNKKIDVKSLVKEFDIFVYDLNKNLNRPILKRITNTPEIHEVQPDLYDNGRYTFLSNENGIYNRFIANLDSSISYIDTAIHYKYKTTIFPLSNFNRNILEYDLSHKTGKYSYLMYKDGKYRFLVDELEKDQIISGGDLKPTIFKYGKDLSELPKEEKQSDVVSVDLIEETNDTTSQVDVDNYKFNDDEPTFEKEVVNLTEQNEEVKDSSKTRKKEEVLEYKKPGKFLYEINFATDYVVSQFDNSFLNATYQRYTGPGSVYFNPGLNGLMKIGLSDLFEDYKVMGGFSISPDLNSEFLLTLDNLSKRVDHKYILYRQAIKGSQAFASTYKNITYEARYQAKYPFSEVAAIRGGVHVRSDRTIYRAINDYFLTRPDNFFNVAGAKLEFIFDNTIPKGLNLYNGTRFKLFAEYFQELNSEKDDFYVVGGGFSSLSKDS